MLIQLEPFSEITRALDTLQALKRKYTNVRLAYSHADDIFAVTLEGNFFAEEGAVLVFTTSAGNDLRIHVYGEYNIKKIEISMNGQPRESKWYKLIEGILTDLEALLARCASKVVHDA